ncbi:MAG: electron transfer flavoprotein subunit beta/FixA family protein, partial [Dehalococcoidia bacterium]
MSQGPHTLVCLKVVPKSEEVGVDMESKTLDRSNARSEINGPDMNALEAALELKEKHGGRVSLLSMGPPFVIPYLRVGLAMGADAAYLLSDRAFGGADTLATSLT